MEELWKDIKGYEGYYQASNFGRIKSLLFQNNVYNKKYKRDKVLRYKGQTYKTGYRVDLWKDGINKTLLVARLVAFTFYEQDIDNHKLTVNHIDGNRFNNNLNNLELISIGDNVRHAFENRMVSTCKAIRITNKNNSEIMDFYSMSKASQYIGHKTGYISCCILKSKYSNKNYKWELL